MASRRVLALLGAAVAAAIALFGRKGRIRPVRMIVSAAAMMVPAARPLAQKLAWRGVYGMWNRSGAGAALMNYGYAPLETDVPDGTDFRTALYEHVAARSPLAGRDVLEIGCGRGGGAAFLFDTRAPRTMTGVDLAKGSIKLARARFERPGLRFLEGDAEQLPFADASFDAVVNVESAHCYPNVPAFLDEVHRVLRPGGVLLIADVRFTERTQANRSVGPVTFEDVGVFRDHVRASPFRVLEEEDITANVRRALELDSTRRRDAVERDVPGRLQPFALMFAGVAGSPLHRDFVEGNYTYLRFRLQKESAADAPAAHHAELTRRE